MLLDFKTYKVRVPTQSDTDIKIDLQFSGIESRNKFIICGQLIFKGTKTNQWERNRLFNKWFGGNYISTCKKMKVDYSVQFSCSVVSNSLTPWIAAHQASLSITNSPSLLRLMSTE